MSTLLRRLGYWLRGRRAAAELEEELQFHREMAGPAFGSVALALEDSRSVWTFGWLESVALDIRYAIRTLAHQPVFAGVVVSVAELASESGGRWLWVGSVGSVRSNSPTGDGPAMPSRRLPIELVLILYAVLVTPEIRGDSRVGDHGGGLAHGPSLKFSP